MKKKTGYQETQDGFAYYGDLVECVVYAERKLRRLQRRHVHLEEKYGRMSERYIQSCKAMDAAERFIGDAAAELRRKYVAERSVPKGVSVAFATDEVGHERTQGAL